MYTANLNSLEGPATLNCWKLKDVPRCPCKRCDSVARQYGMGPGADRAAWPWGGTHWVLGVWLGTLYPSVSSLHPPSTLRTQPLCSHLTGKETDAQRPCCSRDRIRIGTQLSKSQTVCPVLVSLPHITHNRTGFRTATRDGTCKMLSAASAARVSARGRLGKTLRDFLKLLIRKNIADVLQFTPVGK